MIDRNTKCAQVKCSKLSVFRYTWPGKDETGCCAEHADWIQKVADALGMYLQLVELPLPK